MLRRFATERPPLSALLLLIGIFLLGMVLANIVAAAIMIGISGIGMTDLADLNGAIMRSENGWWSLLIGQGAASALMFIGVSLGYWKWLEGRSFADFHTQPLPAIGVFGLVFLIQLLLSPAMGWLQTVNEQMKLPAALQGVENMMKNMETQMGDLTKFMTNYTSPLQFAVVLLVVAIIAGVGEELLFRGLLQRKLYQLFGNPHVAIWVAAALFSAVHFQFYGFLPRLALGALFGYLYYFTGNLWVPIMAHVFNNALAIVVLNLIKNKQISPSFEKMDTLPVGVTAATFFLSVGLLYFLRKTNKNTEGTLPS